MKSIKCCAGLLSSLWRPCITCTGKKDGAGAQIQAVMSTILFARVHGLNYFHTPFGSVEQAPDGKTTAWARAWELATNFGESERSRSDVCFPSERAIGSCNIIRWRPLTLFSIQHCHEFADHYPDMYGPILPELRRRYSNGKREFIYQERADQLQIAIHIRRGDVTAASWPERYSDNSKLEMVVRSIRSVLDNAASYYQIHIFSQGKKSDFGPLNSLPAQWHLETDAIECFDRLVRADILVTAKSSFSYAAALLNPGIIVYEPFWHQPLTHWNVVADDGTLSPDASEQIRSAAEKKRQIQGSYNR